MSPEAAQLRKRSGPLNKLPRKGGRLDIEMLSQAVPDARAMVARGGARERLGARGG